MFINHALLLDFGLSKHFDLELLVQYNFFQTLNSISAEKNSTIIFPLPIDFLTHFMGKGGDSGKRRSNRKPCSIRGEGVGSGNKSDSSSDGSNRHKED